MPSVARAFVIAESLAASTMVTTLYTQPLVRHCGGAPEPYSSIINRRGYSTASNCTRISLAPRSMTATGIG